MSWETGLSNDLGTETRWKGTDPHCCRRFSCTCSLFSCRDQEGAQAPSFSGLSGTSEWSRGAAEQRGGLGKAQATDGVHPGQLSSEALQIQVISQEDSMGFALCLIHMCRPYNLGWASFHVMSL